jgi:hypothetical protein
MKESILILITAFAISGCWWVNLNNVKLSHLNELKQRDSVEVYLNTRLFVRDSLIYNSDAFFTRDKDCKNFKQYYFQNR